MWACVAREEAMQSLPRILLSLYETRANLPYEPTKGFLDMFQNLSWAHWGSIQVDWAGLWMTPCGLLKGSNMLMWMLHLQVQDLPGQCSPTHVAAV